MSNGNVGPPKEAAVLSMAFAFVSSQVLYVAADLGLADYLAGGALTARELANKVAVQADTLPRLLRTLDAFGILKREGEEKSGLT